MKETLVRSRWVKSAAPPTPPRPRRPRGEEGGLHFPHDQPLHRREMHSGTQWQLQYTRRYLYHRFDMVAEIDISESDTATVRRSFVWGPDVSGGNAAGGIGGLLLIRDQSDPQNVREYFPGYDGRGNVTLLVDAQDGSNAAVIEYGIWGDVVRATGDWRATPFLYGTKWSLDQGMEVGAHWPIGLYDYGLRMYNPKLGRFLSRDPIGHAGGLNLYQAFGGDPVNNQDLMGLQFFWTFDGRPSSGSGVPVVSTFEFGNVPVIRPTGGGGSPGGINVSVTTDGLSWERGGSPGSGAPVVQGQFTGSLISAFTSDPPPFNPGRTPSGPIYFAGYSREGGGTALGDLGKSNLVFYYHLCSYDTNLGCNNWFLLSGDSTSFAGSGSTLLRAAHFVKDGELPFAFSTTAPQLHLGQPVNQTSQTTTPPTTTNPPPVAPPPQPKVAIDSAPSGTLDRGALHRSGLAQERDERLWWEKLEDGYYYGTEFGKDAVQYYADITLDPSATWYEKGGAYLGGSISALWTPETYQETGWTLATSAFGAVRTTGTSLTNWKFRIGKDPGFVRMGQGWNHTIGAKNLRLAVGGKNSWIHMHINKSNWNKPRKWFQKIGKWENF